MCWTTRKKDVKFITACKDIPVYKFLLRKDESTYVSPYVSHEYKLGQLYTLGDYDFTALHVWGQKTIYYGFHSYSRGCKVRCNRVFSNKVSIHPFRHKETSYTYSLDWHFKKQFTKVHDLNDPSIIEKEVPMAIVKCIIPKGSCFCINEDGEIVSNQIIIDSEIISVEDFIKSVITFKISSFGEMTTKKQRDAVHFCEKWLKVPFEGDINNFNQVRNYLSNILNRQNNLLLK